MTTTTHAAMVEAAAKIAAMMPALPKPCLMGNREAQLVYSLFECAAKGAYRRAAQECFNVAYDCAGGGIDYEETHALIKSENALSHLILMCEPGYGWGGSVKTI